MKIFVLALLSLYLILTAASVLVDQISQKRLPARKGLLVLFSILLTVIFTYLYLVLDKSSAIYGIGFSLFTLFVVAINNGFYLHGKPHFKHHLIRLIWSIVLLFLLYNIA